MTIEEAIEAVLITKVLTGNLKPDKVERYKVNLLHNYNHHRINAWTYPWVVEAMEVLRANDDR